MIITISMAAAFLCLTLYVANEGRWYRQELERMHTEQLKLKLYMAKREAIRAEIGKSLAARVESSQDINKILTDIQEADNGR